MTKEFLAAMQTGKVYGIDEAREIAALPWNDHSAFRGVSLKHLITGRDTNGEFSSHIVRVKAGCEIGEHLHQGKWELHEILEGSGLLKMMGQEFPYQPGTTTAIPADLPHAVQAYQEDLYILAKFVPALL